MKNCRYKQLHVYYLAIRSNSYLQKIIFYSLSFTFLEIWVFKSNKKSLQNIATEYICQTKKSN